MEIKIVRFSSNQNETQSIVCVDGEKVCFGLEDEYRTKKVMAETRIPSGEYKIQVREYGQHHEKYKKRFQWHRGMLEIKDVPNFKDILIHIGNTDKDTAGCILVGLDIQKISISKKYSLLASEKAYTKLYDIVIEEAIKGNLTVKIVDADL